MGRGLGREVINADAFLYLSISEVGYTNNFPTKCNNKIERNSGTIKSLLSMYKQYSSSPIKACIITSDLLITV